MTPTLPAPAGPANGAPAPEMAMAAAIPALPAPAPAMDGAFGLHLASYRRLQNAIERWKELRAAALSILSGLQPGTAVFTKGAEDEFIRLKAGPIATRAEANALCSELRAHGLYCDVLPYAGTVPF